jgi:hypothetical protein
MPQYNGAGYASELAVCVPIVKLERSCGSRARTAALWALGSVDSDWPLGPDLQPKRARADGPDAPARALTPSKAEPAALGMEALRG